MNSLIIYIGTGGYRDTHLLGTLYPYGTSPSDFLKIYACHYDTVEINSTFHAPIGLRAIQGMVDKAAGQLCFSVKLHQNFSHTRCATFQQAQHFLKVLSPLKNHLANLCVQFPFSFERNPSNRYYLLKLTEFFQDYPLAIELRHPSWHIPQVFEFFATQPQLIWCHADYPLNIGLPTFSFQPLGQTAYWRLHGRNSNWHLASSAAERHDYCYDNNELWQFAVSIYRQRSHLNKLYIYFQNTTKSHSFHNIVVLKQYLTEMGLNVKNTIDSYGMEQGCLF